MASAWAFRRDGSAWVIDTPTDETVRLAPAQDGDDGGEGTLSRIEEISCSCLLGPRCLHVLAILVGLPLADLEEAGVDATAETKAEAEAASTPSTTSSEESEDDHVALTTAQRASASTAFSVGARWLESGASAAGGALLADTLRCAHDARARSLPRLARAALRLVRLSRALQQRSAELRFPELEDAVLELLSTAWHLQHEGRPSQAWVGVARRAFAPIEGRRLSGLFSEPVLGQGGYAGVVTWLCDARGGLFTVSEIMPGEAERAPLAYDASVRIGDATVTHRALCRSGLFVTRAIASSDGRLGMGSGGAAPGASRDRVEAVASAPSSWSDAAVLFRRPWAEQIERTWAARERPIADRPGGWDLVFLPVTLAGAAGDAVLAHVGAGVASGPGGLDANERVLRCVPASEHPLALDRANLRRLARATGRRAWVIGRVVPTRTPTVELLAIGSPPDATADERASDLVLAKELGGRASLGLDALQGASEAPAPPAASAGAATLARDIDDTRSVPEPLADLRRRLMRVVAGGRATLPASIHDEVAREAALLDRRLLGGGADALRALAHAAALVPRTMLGTRAAPDPTTFARAWLAASTWQRAASAVIDRTAWQLDP